MSKADDLRFTQSESFGAQGHVLITNDINEISRMTNGDFMLVYLSQGVFGTPDSGTTIYPNEDEMRLYVKHDGRTFMTGLTEVTEQLLTR
jgi:hypothetical protein